MTISLLAFAIVSVVATVVAQLWRILAFDAVTVDDGDSIELTPVESAFLTGGALSAIAVLNAASLSPGLDHARPRARIVSEANQSDQDVSALLSGIEQSLIQRGLLLSPRQRVSIYLASCPLFAVAAIGLAQSMLNIAGKDETVLLAGSSVFLLLLAIGLIATVPRRSRLGMTLSQRGTDALASAPDTPVQRCIVSAS